MDEADKYKQRLEVIAEKRRLQEEQEKARREMEEQKLRLQQLKRKSLRDQWLMEGTPLSPTSPDAHSPRSPLWGSQAQEIEKHIDTLHSQSQQLAVEEEKLKELMEDGQMEAVKVEEVGSETVHAVVHNSVETTEDDVKTNQSPPVDGTVAVLINGGGSLETGTSPNASEHRNQSTANGPVAASEGVISMTLKPGLYESQAEPHEVPNVIINEEEEEDGTLVMRAECVIVTDEDDDLAEDPQPQNGQGNDVQSEETPPWNPDLGHEGGGAVEGVEPAAVEAFTPPECGETAEPTAEPAFADGDTQDAVKTSKDSDEETKDEEQDKQSESTSVQVQPSSCAVEGATLSPVPVYSETALGPEPEAQTADAMSPEGALAVQDPATLPDQFQEVPLSDPQEKQRKEAGPEEQEPLLSEVKAPDIQAEPASDNVPIGTETHSQVRATQRGETEAPKRKTCQCCSVM